MRTWVLLLGVVLMVYAASRYLTGIIGEGVGGENNLLVSAIVFGVGLVLTVVSQFMKEESA